MLKAGARPIAFVDLQSCVGCEWCVWACPFDALVMGKTPGAGPNDKGNQGTPIPGINEMSSGFETLVRNADGEVILTGPNFGDIGNINDLVTGEFLDAGIFDTQSISLQFAPEQASIRAITRWALRFGSVMTSQPGQDKDGGPETWYRTDFDYYGIAVKAYAHIPAAPAAT